MAGAGLVDVDVRPFVMEVPYGAVEAMIGMHTVLMTGLGVPADAIEAWQRELEFSNLEGTFYMAMTMFSAVGRKP
jgi:hypothetical protein